MIDFTFTIEKLGSDVDEALLRFIVPVPDCGVAECYLDNDQLTNLAHVLSKFLRYPETAATSYTLGSFEPSYAGGALAVGLFRTGTKLSVTLEIIDESSKGSRIPEALTAAVAVTDIEHFATALRALHAAERGTAQLALTRQ